jgi:transcriptional regulator with XRE-family HTH domain
MNDKKLNAIGLIQDLEAVRQQAGLTQADLAQAAGVNRMTVSRIEAGFDPRLSTLYELIRALDMDVLLVPKALKQEVQGFIQSGGRLLGQAPGIDAPKSVVQLLAEPATSATTADRSAPRP